MVEDGLKRDRGVRDVMVLLALALVLRLPRLLFFSPVVEGDGAEYSRIAENLARGEGYQGLLEGPELMLPPLYPLVIAGLKLIAPGVATPLLGRLVSLAAGLVTVLLAYLLGRRLSGPRAARWTALAVATMPAFVLSSTSVFAESLQTALLAAAFLYFERATAGRTVTSGLLSGVFFGLSYLTRVEGLALAALAAVLLATGWPRKEAPRRPALLPSLALVLGFLAAASPYVSWLDAKTGQVRFEGKAERVFAAISRYAAGEDYASANYAIDTRGRELGPWLSPNVPSSGPGLIEVITANPAGFCRHLLKNLGRAAWMLASGATVASGCLWIAVVYALFAKRKTRGAAAMDLLLIATVAYGVAVTCLYKIVLRYLFLLAMPLALWTGRFLAGVEERFTGRRPIFAAAVAAAILILPLWRGLVTGFGEFDEASSTHLPVLEAAAAVRKLAAPGDRLISDDPRVAYASGTTWIPLPAAPDAPALRDFCATRSARWLAVRAPQAGKPFARPGAFFDERGFPPEIEPLGRAGEHLLFRLR